MGVSYSPAPGAEPDSPYSTAFLSQRDLGLQVPINYVTQPGASLSAACFPHLRYEDDDFGDCLSNLLAVGFRSFEIDFYWDEGRNLWSFCPVAIPNSLLDAMSSSTATIVPSSSSLSTATPSLFSSPSSTGSSSLSSGINARQITSENNSSSTSITTSHSSITAGTSLGQALPSIVTVPDTPNVPFVSIGPYVCTTTVSLSLFTTLILDYIENTQNTIGAHLLHVILNIHTAAPYASPSSPGRQPLNLPDPSRLIGSLFGGNLSTYIYTPSNLRSDRENLNSSWFTVAGKYRPLEGYYETRASQYGIISTEDGWPSASYIEFSKSKRLLLGWGTIDPQMAGYDFSGDSNTIFASGYLQDIQTNITANGNGSLTSGRFLRSGTDNLSEVNSSWAVETNLTGFDYPTTPTSDLIPLLDLTSNTTACGISPHLNFTLMNNTAHNNCSPYQDYAYSTIWSWAPGEPHNSTTSPDSHFRCASTSLSLSGKWSVSSCSDKYPAACRGRNSPYNWTITSYPISYSYAGPACPDDYTFAAPRTALENNYLRQEIYNDRRKRGEDGGTGLRRVWVDFNSLDTSDCWVTGGPNATCPYNGNLDLDNFENKRIIWVPTIAAIIVLVISALTVFVKVAGNRKVRKRSRRRRADNGFVYEGVPS